MKFLTYFSFLTTIFSVKGDPYYAAVLVEDSIGTIGIYKILKPEPHHSTQIENKAQLLPEERRFKTIGSTGTFNNGWIVNVDEDGLKLPLEMTWNVMSNYIYFKEVDIPVFKFEVMIILLADINAFKLHPGLIRNQSQQKFKLNKTYDGSTSKSKGWVRDTTVLPWIWQGLTIDMTNGSDSISVTQIPECTTKIKNIYNVTDC